MKRAAIAFNLLLGSYALSYAILSSKGAYAPTAWSLGQHGMEPRWYTWAPWGLYAPASGEWIRKPLLIFYLPLIFADNHLWHTHGYHPELSNAPMHPAIFPKRR